MKYGKDVCMINRMSKNKYYLYTVSFAISSFVILIPFILKGNSLIANGDTYNGLFPAFVYIKDFWRELLRGELNSFNFSIGLGEDAFTAMPWAGIFDIISIIVSLLTPIEYIEIGFGFSILLRLYLCGLSFLCVSQRYVKSEKIAVVGALLYAFNVYTLFWGMYYYLFITPLIVFPLVIRGIDQIVDGKAIDILMVIALCMQGLNGFYFLYVIVLASIMYYGFVAVFRMGVRNRIEIGNIIIKGIYIALNGVLGIALSGVVFIPSLFGLFSSSRKMGKQIATELICNSKYFTEAIGVSIIPSVWNSVLTFSNIALAAIILYVFVKNKRKEIFYITIVLWGLLWCPLWGSIMNGFTYSTDRWFFILVFFVNVITIMSLESDEEMPIIGWSIYFCVIAISTIIHIINSEKMWGLCIRILAFLLLVGVLPLILKKRECREKIIFLYGFCVVTTILFFVFAPKFVGGNGYSSNFKANGVYEEIVNSSNKLEFKSDGFERWDIYDSSYAASFLGKYNGTTSYYSTLNKNIYNFYVNMNISPSAESNFTLRGLDSRQEIMSLLSVSYYMDYVVNDKEQNIVTRENLYYLPLGFTYDSYITEEEFNKLQPIRKNTQILNTIVLVEDNKKIDIGQIKNGALTKINVDIINRGARKKRVYLDFKEYEKRWIDKKGSVYVYIDDTHDRFVECFVGNKKIYLRDSEDLIDIGIEDCWINITELKKDLNGWYFDIDFQGETDFENSKLKVYWEDIDYKAIEERGKNTLKNLEILNNRIVGEISTTKNEMLFFSIPYSSGWKAYIDGEESELYKANIGFMAVLVEEGKHNIELRYETPGFKVGLACSVVAIIMLIVVWVYNKNHKWNGDIE